MTRWSVVVAAAGATASSGTTVLLLGNPGLQRAVTGTLPELFGASAAFVAAGAVAFALTFVLARALRLAPRDVWAVALVLLALDVLATGAASLLVGELSVANPGPLGMVFLVLSALGLQFVAAAAGVWLGARRTT